MSSSPITAAAEPVSDSAEAARERPLLIALFAVALLVNVWGLTWGLPNGNDTWANDAIRPGAPLSIFYRIFVAEPLNSGWFWFKYPPGHVFILGAVYAPYMAWQFLSGAIAEPTSVYPYGMADPEATLAILALLGRAVSATMGAGCVALVYLALRPAFGLAAAVAGAIATAFCYPFVYYAHTTNVEVPYVFWLLVAFTAASRLVALDDRPRWWALLGLGAAMSVSTKEIGAGFFVGLPPVILVAHLLARRPTAALLRGGAIAAAATVVTLVLANNILLNPTGFMNRVGFLTQTLPREVALQYAPYYFPIRLGAGKGLAAELAQLALAGDRLYASLGLASALLAVGGVVQAARTRPWWTALALAGAATFYLLGARAMLSLSMRYVMPLTLVAVMFAGVAAGALMQPGRLAVVRRGVAALAMLYVVAYGWDVNRMLVGDPRYAAEAWLEEQVREGEVIEIYQPATYLPRMPARARVEHVAFDERSVEELRRRSPDYVVVSSAGIAAVTLAYKTDWKGEEQRSDEWVPSQRAADGTVMNYRRRANMEMLEGIRSGELGYVEAARFSLRPWIQRPLVQSLNPEITVYRRRPSAHAAD